ncbi:hypothetical protein D018_2303A, partial [Vibrio parahaemolyticus VP2007-007]
MDSNWLA